MKFTAATDPAALAKARDLNRLGFSNATILRITGLDLAALYLARVEREDSERAQLAASLRRSRLALHAEREASAEFRANR